MAHFLTRRVSAHDACMLNCAVKSIEEHQASTVHHAEHMSKINICMQDMQVASWLGSPSRISYNNAPKQRMPGCWAHLICTCGKSSRKWLGWVADGAITNRRRSACRHGRTGAGQHALQWLPAPSSSSGRPCTPCSLDCQHKLRGKDTTALCQNMCRLWYFAPHASKTPVWKSRPHNPTEPTI